MKKLLTLLTVLTLVLSLAACASTPADDNATDTPPVSNQNPEPSEEVAPVTIADYSVVGMSNVTNVYFSAPNENGHYTKRVDPANATAVVAELMCPYCHSEGSIVLDFSKFSESQIGQQTFTWTDTFPCYDWSDHEDTYNSDYTYALMFTLNG